MRSTKKVISLAARLAPVFFVLLVGIADAQAAGGAPPGTAALDTLIAFVHAYAVKLTVVGIILIGFAVMIENDAQSFSRIGARRNRWHSNYGQHGDSWIFRNRVSPTEKKPEGWFVDMLSFEPQKKFGGDRSLGLASVFIPLVIVFCFPLLPIPPWVTVGIAVAVHIGLRLVTLALWHYDKWALQVYAESMKFPEFIPSHTSACAPAYMKVQLHAAWTKARLRRK
jgi:hypothetical protein